MSVNTTASSFLLLDDHTFITPSRPLGTAWSHPFLFRFVFKILRAALLCFLKQCGVLMVEPRDLILLG